LSLSNHSIDNKEDFAVGFKPNYGFSFWHCIAKIQVKFNQPFKK